VELCTSVCMFLISRDLVQHLASAVNVVVYKSRLRTYTTQMFRCMNVNACLRISLLPWDVGASCVVLAEHG
jgi:hypothetical protein